MRTIQVKPSIETPRLDRRFGRYKGETESSVRKIVAQRDPRLAGFHAALDESTKDGWSITAEYVKACKMLCGMGITARDIEAFSVSLGTIPMPRSDDDAMELAESMGIFLSAMAGCSKDPENIIRTSHLPILPEKLGYMLLPGKRFIVEGDIGDFAGSGLRGGTIEVLGNAGDFAGERMEGGTLIVKGSCGSYAGLLMSGGKLIAEGRAGYMLGEKMTGGELDLRKDFGSISQEFNGGKIFNKGKLIAVK